MEFWDILDADGKRIGKTVQKGTVLQQNEYHLVVHIWLADRHDFILIQQRAKHLEWMPGVWAVTSSAVLTNETSMDAAVRGTRDELGLHLNPSQFIKMCHTRNHNQLTDIYLVTGSREEFLPIVLGDKVADAFWTTWRGMIEMVNRKEFLGYEYLDKVLPGISRFICASIT